MADPSPRVTAASRPRRSDQAVWVSIDGQGYVLADQELQVLNPIGLALWELLDGRATVTDLVEGVVDAFGIDHDRAQHDVGRFLDALSERSLIR